MNFKLTYFIFFTGFICTTSFSSPGDSSLIGQKLRTFEKNLEEKNIEIVQMYQFWNVTTLKNAGSLNKVRNDLFFRRARIGLRGNLHPKIRFNVIFCFDGLGREEGTAGLGGTNEPDNRDFYLWDASATYSLTSLLNLTVGYFRPQIGRESITAAFAVISFDKSLPNYQPRLHTSGRSSGREMGVNLGGIYFQNGWSMNYNIGYTDMTRKEIIGQGKLWAPMLSGRFAFTLGDPEMEKYQIIYTQSYYTHRRGITLALNGSYHGKTDVFRNNSFTGGDILLNYDHLDIVAEYDCLFRKSNPDSLGNSVQTRDQVFSSKAGYNFLLKKGTIIQPSVTYTFQIAAKGGTMEHKNSYTGCNDHELIDLGLNYIIRENRYKISIHYIWGKKRDVSSNPGYSFIGTGIQCVL